MDRLVVMKVGTESATSNCASINKIDKIPEYVNKFRKEWLCITGINKEFKYFVDNLDQSTIGLFQNPRVARIKKFIKRFLLSQERGRLKDTSNFELEGEDVCFLIKLDKNFDNFCQYIMYKKDFLEENDKYVCPYPGFDDIYDDFKLFFNKFKIRKKEFNYYYFGTFNDYDFDVFDSD